MIIYLRSAFLAFFAVYFLIIPTAILIHDLRDPGLYNNQIPHFTYRWHRSLSGEITPWATDRVESLRALELTTDNVSGTEWPMFSAVFYLWATEALQDDWESNPAISKKAPNVYAKPAIEAAAKLITDPNNAAWVIEHWGDDYLESENLFYRMLLIAGLTSYQKLLGDVQYQGMLVDQIESLSAELDASPHGLLDDYPGECYPVDIVPAIAVIKRASEMLGMDKAIFLSRSLRGFEGDSLDDKTNLPAYSVGSKSGKAYGPARGVGVSYMLVWAPELWPDTADYWYQQYEKHFWSRGGLVSGFLEFSRDTEVEALFFDVDAGPVVQGYGVAASAFGIAAARVNNQAEQSYPLAAEALVASWPLPHGTLLVPRMLSNLSDAPYIGESALLFAMTRTPVTDLDVELDFIIKKRLPNIVYIGLLSYGLLGGVILWSAIRLILSARRG